MLTYNELVNALRELNLGRFRPILAHTSLSSFGDVHGGAETILGALLRVYSTVIMPTFTYKTMLIPESGPPNNGLTYGSGKSNNRMAEFFRPNMPADRLMGVVAEAFRQHPDSCRSKHPILSFTGIRANDALAAQTIKNPLAPIQVLAADWGWVLLLGVNHSVNTSIHHGEKTAGRKQFIRWALTPRGIQECPGFPGCSNGFQTIAPHLENVRRQVNVGRGVIQAFPLPALVTTVQNLISYDPQALLCEQAECGRCSTIRKTGL